MHNEGFWLVKTKGKLNNVQMHIPSTSKYLCCPKVSSTISDGDEQEILDDIKNDVQDDEKIKLGGGSMPLMNSVLVRNTRGLTRASKWLETKHFISKKNINLFSFLKT